MELVICPKCRRAMIRADIYDPEGTWMKYLAFDREGDNG